MSEHLSAESDGVRQTLADHFVMWHEVGGPDQSPGEWRCACGLKFGFSDSAIDHVAERVQSRAVKAVVEALERPITDAWSSYMDGPGGKTEAFRQGKYEGLDRARRIAVRALRDISTPPGSPTPPTTPEASA